MINGRHLYSAFIQRAVQLMLLIHTQTAIGCRARYRPPRQERLGVRRLAQEHFDTPRAGPNRQPLPPEPLSFPTREAGNQIQLIVTITRGTSRFEETPLSHTDLCGLSFGLRKSPLQNLRWLFRTSVLGSCTTSCSRSSQTRRYNRHLPSWPPHNYLLKPLPPHAVHAFWLPW